MSETTRDRTSSAALTSVETRERILLRAWHVVGRSRKCTMRLDNPRISKQHALIVWDGSQWNLRDLHSRNGTWLGDARVQPGRDVPLTVGTAIAFGSPSERWQVCGLGAPTACAISLDDDREQRADSGLLTLPSADAPAAVIFKTGDRWLIERADGSSAPVDDHDHVVVDGAVWRVHLPEPVDVTCLGGPQPTPETITLRFQAGPPLTVSWRYAGQENVLSARVHQHLLHALAKARVRDQARVDLPEAEHGWLYRDELEDQLGIRDNRLYVYVCRARAQLARAGILDAGRVFERRSDTRQIRIGVSRLVLIS